jgi:hypothetical protein
MTPPCLLNPILQAIRVLDGLPLVGKDLNIELAAPTCEFFDLPPKPKEVTKSMMT